MPTSEGITRSKFASLELELLMPEPVLAFFARLRGRDPQDASSGASSLSWRERAATRKALRKALKIRETHLGDRIFHGGLKVLAWATILMVASIIGLLLKMSLPIFAKFGAGFFIGTDWNPVEDTFGALPFIYGTIVTSLMALLMAAPISIGVAVFLTEIAPKWLSKTIGFLVEMLAAIPSVVYGLWGIFILAPFMQATAEPRITEWLGPGTLFSKVLGLALTIIGYPVILIANIFLKDDWSLQELSLKMTAVAAKLFGPPHFGVGMFTASVVLAIMITPTIAAITREVFSTVNENIKEASLALGATRWEMIKMAVLKTSRSGMIGAVILGLGRALGETMAVTMVIGNRNDITAALMAPGQTMSSVIANEYNEASGLHMAALAGVGLSLFAVSLVVNSIARMIIWRVEGGGRGK
jgi:phosphate transport system permease protein